MKKLIFCTAVIVLCCSHIMYLKMDSYFLEPDTPVQIKLFNGTFDKSENVIDRDRMLDVSLVGNGNRSKVDNSQWTEKDSITLLNFQTGEAGTWVVGLSTAPRSIEMDAEAFNSYLEHEGILDMITWRKENNVTDGAVVEKYSKHVKAIFQVGATKSNDWQTALGYPIEFVPLENPYDLVTGDSLTFKLLLNGKPLANQLVYANYKAQADGHSHDSEKDQSHSHDATIEEKHEHPDTSKTKKVESHSHESETKHSHGDEKGNEHSHDDKIEDGHSHDATEKSHSHEEESAAEHSYDGTENHTHTAGQQMRTDANGEATAVLNADGIWYLQTIHLVNTEEEGFTHESNWTTLTFEVAHGHGEETHTHEEEGGIPSYLYWLGSIFLVGILFFWFNKKN